MKDFLAAGAALRLDQEHLPDYALEPSGAEGVWNLLKRGELKSRCCQNLDELRSEFGLAIRRLRRNRRLLVVCFRQCGTCSNLCSGQYPPMRLYDSTSPVRAAANVYRGRERKKMVGKGENRHDWQFSSPQQDGYDSQGNGKNWRVQYNPRETDQRVRRSHSNDLFEIA